MSEWLEFLKITGAGAAAAAVITAVLHIFAERRKKKAETGQIDAESQASLVGVAENVVKMLRSEMSRLAEANLALHKRIEHLETDMASLKSENRLLAGRCKHLEEENARLEEKLAR